MNSTFNPTSPICLLPPQSSSQTASESDQLVVEILLALCSEGLELIHHDIT